jgi:hypothetical protein
MIRLVLRADGTASNEEVGEGFRTWNQAIKASIGTIVFASMDDVTRGVKQEIELWCDDEALMVNEPVGNVFASMLAGQPIFGDVIVFRPGDIT